MPAVIESTVPVYPRGWFTVHFGVRSTAEHGIEPVAAMAQGLAVATMTSSGTIMQSFVDGDGWAEWGEHRDTHVNGENPNDYHVQLATPSLAMANTAWSWIERTGPDARDIFVPLPGGPARFGLTKTAAFAVISGSEDWASGDDLMRLLGNHDWFIDE